MRHATGRRFIAVSESKNQAEAEYRYVLTRVRENAESIALLRGDDEERKDHLFVLTAASIFASVARNWYSISELLAPMFLCMSTTSRPPA